MPTTINTAMTMTSPFTTRTVPHPVSFDRPAV
jgi:hypothetical protein